MTAPVQWRIREEASFQEQVQSLKDSERQEVMRFLAQLAKDPGSPGMRARELRATLADCRVLVLDSGQLVLYSVDESTHSIAVLAIVGHENESMQTLPQPGSLAPGAGLLDITPSGKALLTPTTKPLASVVEAIISTKASQCSIEVTSFVLAALRDPNEKWSELVFEVKVSALPAQALAFWDSIGAEVDRWKSKLPAHLQEVLAERIAVHVSWS